MCCVIQLIALLLLLLLPSRSSADHGEAQVIQYDLLVGADGAMSAVRQAMMEHCPGMKVNKLGMWGAVERLQQGIGLHMDGLWEREPCHALPSPYW